MAYDHDATLKEIERLWGAEPGTPDGDRLSELVDQAHIHEDQTVQIGIDMASGPDQAAVVQMNADGSVSPANCTIGLSLFLSINGEVERAHSTRLKAENAQAKAAAALLPSERALVFRDLPPVPSQVVVSPDALFELLNHDGEALATANTEFLGGWVLNGCGLPLVIDNKTRCGHSYRLETAEGAAI